MGTVRAPYGHCTGTVRALCWKRARCCFRQVAKAHTHTHTLPLRLLLPGRHCCEQPRGRRCKEHGSHCRQGQTDLNLEVSYGCDRTCEQAELFRTPTATAGYRIRLDSVFELLRTDPRCGTSLSCPRPVNNILQVPQERCDAEPWSVVSTRQASVHATQEAGRPSLGVFSPLPCSKRPTVV